MLSISDPAPATLPARAPVIASGGMLTDRLRSAWKSGWIAVVLITAGAAALRLVNLGSVRLDPFYDAAVRSMSVSWHNFFFGAFEPGGSVSIDKPPLDLWLQVASVKLFGWSSTTLKLPEALAGTVSAPLLFAAIRRVFGIRAGLAAALAIAVLPIEVITARSDTMDAVMMALILLSLLAVVRAGESASTTWLLLAGAALGLAFNVKLLESLVALPGLVLLAYLGRPEGVTRPRRLVQLLVTAAVFVAVALSWLTATLLIPAHDRPFAIGSTNGSAWNAAFVFNGLDRISGKTVESQQEGFVAGRSYPETTQSERDQIPITPPSPVRLLERIGPLSGERLGLEVLAALLLGVPALLFAARGSPELQQEPSPANEPAIFADASQPRWRLRRAMALGLLLWLAMGIALFSDMARLHPRYVEGFTPAVAAVLGIGAAWATDGTRGRGRSVALAVGLIAIIVYAERLLFGVTAIWWVVLVTGLTACAAAVTVSRSKREPTAWRGARPSGARPRFDGRPSDAASAVVLALTLIALLTVPLSSSLQAIHGETSDAGNVGALRPEVQRLLGAYLRTHQGSAHYELAAASATKVASLIVQDARPVLVLTTYNARTLTGVSKLRRLIAAGAVRYAFLDSLCGPRTPRTDAGCSAPALWVRAHAIDVSAQAGLKATTLWRLPKSIGS